MKSWMVPIKIAISALILTFLAIRAVKENQFAQLFESPRSFLWLAGAFAGCLAAHLVAMYRWYLLSRALSLPLTLYDSVRIGMIGVFFGIVAFGVVGTDALRAYYVARQSHGQRTAAVATVFVDRLIGLLTMFLAAFLGLYWGQLAVAETGEQNHSLQGIRVTCWLAGALFAAGMMAMVLAMLAPGFRRFRWFERLEAHRLVKPVLSRLIHVMILYRSRLGTLGIGFVLSGVVNLCFVVTIYLVAAFVSDQHPTLGDHLTIAPISMVANAVPLPGGAGGMEAVLDLLYQTYAAHAQQPQIGVVVAFLFRILLLLMAGLGAVAWFSLPESQRQDLKQAGDEIVAEATAG